MFLLHIVLAMISLITYASLSTLESEPMSCKILYPLNHILYFLLNIILVFFYLSTIMATSSSNLQFFQNSKILVVILGLFSAYSFLVKILSDQVCEFWTLHWSKIILSMIVFCSEGYVVVTLFKWYVDKSTKVRDQMMRCIQRMDNVK